MYTLQSFPRVRRHTLAFLKHTRHHPSVTIQTEIDATKLVACRYKNARKISYVSFFILAISKILTAHPLANSAYRPGLFPKIISFQEVHAKFTLDRWIGKTRVVLSSVIPCANTCTLDDIQDQIEYDKKADFDSEKRFSAIKILHALPVFLGSFLFGRVIGMPAKSLALQGSFTITSLGHQPIDLFIPKSGGTLTFALGQIKERAVIQNGVMVIKPTVMLTLVFDHRVLDGADAADLLADIKNKLESDE